MQRAASYTFVRHERPTSVIYDQKNIAKNEGDLSFRGCHTPNALLIAQSSGREMENS